MGLKNLHFPASHSKAEAADGDRAAGTTVSERTGSSCRRTAVLPSHEDVSYEEDAQCHAQDKVKVHQCPCLSGHLSWKT